VLALTSVRADTAVRLMFQAGPPVIAGAFYNRAEPLETL
jgi:hypothetical protein